MKAYGVIPISFFLLGILITLALPSNLALAQDNPTVLQFFPTALELKPDGQGTVNIIVENAQNLYGLEFQVSFDPGLLSVIDADPLETGVQIKPAGWWKDGFVAVNKVDNAGGRIDFAATLLRPAGAVSGKQVIVATITLSARQSGSSALTFAEALLSNRSARALAFSKQAGEIRVNSGNQAAQGQALSAGAGQAAGRLALAGAGALAFLAALGGLILCALQAPNLTGSRLKVDCLDKEFLEI